MLPIVYENIWSSFTRDFVMIMKFNPLKMMNPDVFEHPVSNLELIETHISWVILTGDIVYKIKKPVNFGFLDFSTLEKRHEYCEQEVQLNSRLAPELYLGVVSISGTVDAPVINGNGEAFEYAVKMAQFPQSAQLDNKLAAGELDGEHMDAIAQMVADFHATTAVADNAVNYGDKEIIKKPVVENFELISAHLNTNKYAEELSGLKHWSDKEFVRLEAIIEQRKTDGFVRECHGDMHLRNLVWLDNKPLAFDCIEFNPELRWIDVISEVAFLVMDLQDRQQSQLAHHFLNSYLEKTGDYEGLSVLLFYLCYRAMVRAKVDALRIEQEGIDQQEREQQLTEFESYLTLASRYTKSSSPILIIMRGLSASGKSTVSQRVLDKLGAIRIRSDIERKRLFDISIDDKTSNSINAGLYSEQASQKTYAKLAELASQIIQTGFSVIVDAAFLKYEQRKVFQQLANQLSVPYCILEVTAPVEVLRKRIVARTNDVSDANLEVLEHQLSTLKPLQAKERDAIILINTEETLDIDSLIDDIHTKQ